MTKKAFILIGVPGSGKSTHVNAHKREGVRVFSLDTCRLAFAKTTDYAKAFSHCIDRKQEFDAFVNDTWKCCLKDATEIYVDNVNATRKSRARWIADLKANGYEVHAVQFVVPLQVAIDRQQTRGDKCVPAEVIAQMHNSIQEVLVPSECVTVQHVKSF